MTICLVGTPDPEGSEPTAAELQAIEAERPIVEAELAVVAAECAYLARPSEVARSRVRRAEGRLVRLLAGFGCTTPTPLPNLGVEADTGRACNEFETTTDMEGVAS